MKKNINHNNYHNHNVITKYLIIDSLLEGLLFVLVYSIIEFNKYNIIIIGIFLHLISEIIGIHTLFHKYRCS